MVSGLLIDPLGQPKVTLFSHMLSVRTTKQQKTIFATGVTTGLAGWIIDDTCLVRFTIGMT